MNQNLIIMNIASLNPIFIFLIVLLTACGSSANKSANTVAPEKNWYKPKPAISWQWQLQGLVTSSHNAAVYDIDLFDSPQVLIEQLQNKGSKVICYFSAGSYENWRSDANQFKTTDLGQSLDGWEGEHWLDIRSITVRNIMKIRLELAKQKGCDAVEPDNMDAYTNNSGFPLSAADQLNFNRFIAKEAHSRGLSVGLKNDLDQINALVDDFDFAVNEQCFEFSECDLLMPFINQGKAVFNAEYKQLYVNDASARATLCKQAKALKFSSLILPLDLDDSFRYSCSALP